MPELFAQRHHVTLDVWPAAIFAKSFYQVPALLEWIAAPICRLHAIAVQGPAVSMSLR